MTGSVVFVTERAIITLAFMATAVVLLLNQALLGPYGQLVVGGLMTAFGTVMTSWFAAHSGQAQQLANAAPAPAAPVNPAPGSAAAAGGK